MAKRRLYRIEVRGKKYVDLLEVIQFISEEEDRTPTMVLARLAWRSAEFGRAERRMRRKGTK